MDVGILIFISAALVVAIASMALMFAAAALTI
jgi:hypothetical protein